MEVVLEGLYHSDNSAVGTLHFSLLNAKVTYDRVCRFSPAANHYKGPKLNPEYYLKLLRVKQGH
jgi:hypothetical protein